MKRMTGFFVSTEWDTKNPGQFTVRASCGRCGTALKPEGPLDSIAKLLSAHSYLCFVDPEETKCEV